MASPRGSSAPVFVRRWRWSPSSAASSSIAPDRLDAMRPRRRDEVIQQRAPAGEPLDAEQLLGVEAAVRRAVLGVALLGDAAAGDVVHATALLGRERQSSRGCRRRPAGSVPDDGGRTTVRRRRPRSGARAGRRPASDRRHPGRCPLDADAPEADRLVEAEARSILAEHAGEQRPQPGGLGRRDDGLEQGPADAPPAGGRPDVDALPGHAGVDAPRRVGRQGRPAEDRTAGTIARHQPAVVAVRMVEMAPVRRPRPRASRRPWRCPPRRCGGPPASRRRSWSRSGARRAWREP